jgi:DNA-binding HxlR family transcriptional regulator
VDSLGSAIDVLGDRWTLLILRDVIFEDRRHFRALLLGSPEGIASNILADRLVRLVEAGILARGTAARGQRARYSLTESGIQTVPVLIALSDWAVAWRPGDTPSPVAVDELMADLRRRHLQA